MSCLTVGLLVWMRAMIWGMTTSQVSMETSCACVRGRGRGKEEENG